MSGHILGEVNARAKDNGWQAMDVNVKQIASSTVVPWPWPHSRRNRRLPPFVAVKLVHSRDLSSCGDVRRQYHHSCPFMRSGCDICGGDGALWLVKLFALDEYIFFILSVKLWVHCCMCLAIDLLPFRMIGDVDGFSSFSAFPLFIFPSSSSLLGLLFLFSSSSASSPLFLFLFRFLFLLLFVFLLFLFSSPPASSYILAFPSTSSFPSAPSSSFASFTASSFFSLPLPIPRPFPSPPLPLLPPLPPCLPLPLFLFLFSSCHSPFPLLLPFPLPFVSVWCTPPERVLHALQYTAMHRFLQRFHNVLPLLLGS